MGRIVTGVFERAADAERARAELLSSGFKHIDIELHRSAATCKGGAARLDAALAAAASTVGERARRCVIAVHIAQDREEQSAEDALQRCGAIDVRRSSFATS